MYHDRKLAAVLVVLLSAGFLTAGCSKEARRDRHLRRANDFLQTQQFEKATIEYLNALRLDPENLAAIRQLGLTYFERGQFARAFPLLLRTEILATNDLDVRLKLGQLYQAAQLMAEARSEALFVLERNPADAAALLLLFEIPATAEERAQDRLLLDRFRQHGGGPATQLMAEGSLRLYAQDYAGAESNFQQAATLDPKSSRAQLALAFLHRQQGRDAQADQAYRRGSDLARSNSLERLKWAQFKLDSGAFDEARKDLEDLTSRSPDFTPAWGLLAMVTFEQRDYDTCSKLVDEVLRQDPRSFTGLLLRAKVSAERGDGPKVIEDLKRLASDHMRSPRAHYELALMYRRSGDVRQAAASLQQVLALDPNNVDARRSLGQLSLAKGDPIGAMTFLEPLTTQNARDWLAQLGLAEAYRMQDRPADAINVYLNLMSLFPDKHQVPFFLGLTYRQEGSASAARSAFEKALSIAPGFLPAVNQLVELLLLANDVQPASQLVEDMLFRSPDSAEVHLLLGKVRAGEGKLDQAEAALRQAVKLDPHLTSAHATLAQLLVSTRRHLEALAGLEELRKVNPNDVSALTQIALLQEHLKDYVKAAEAYEAVLATAPDAGLVLNNLGYLYSERLHNPAKGFELAKRARAVLPDNPVIADTLGWINFRLKRYPAALQLLQEAAAKLPSQPVIQYHLGMADYVLGNEEAARQAFERALHLSARFEGSDDATQRLAILRIDPSHVDQTTVALLADRTDDPVALLRLAAICDTQGETARAVTLYEKALTDNPRFLKAALRLAELYSNDTNRLERALELAKGVRPLADSEPSTLAVLGRIAYQAGDPSWGLDLLTLAGSSGLKDPRLEYDTALCLYYRGDVAEAVRAAELLALAQGASEHADRARELLFWIRETEKPRMEPEVAKRIEATVKTKPEFLPSRYASALYHIRTGELEGGQRVLETIVKQQPQFRPAKRELALLLLRSGDDQNAYPLLVQTRPQYPRDPELTAGLASLEYRRRNYAAVVRLLRNLREECPDDAESHFYLGMAQVHLNRTAEAKDALRRAVELNLKNPLAEECTRVLADLYRQGAEH